MVHGETILEIPVTPLVHYWLNYKHGPVLNVDHKNVYGRQLYLSLGRKPLDRWELSTNKYSKTIQVRLTKRTAVTRGKHLSTQAVVDFNKAVKNVFLEFFHGLMDYERKTTELSIEKIYYKFVEAHPGLEEVFNWLRAQKGYDRYRYYGVDKVSKDTISEVVL